MISKARQGYAIHKKRIESIQNGFLRNLNFRYIKYHVSIEDCKILLYADIKHAEEM